MTKLKDERDIVRVKKNIYIYSLQTNLICDPIKVVRELYNFFIPQYIIHSLQKLDLNVWAPFIILNRNIRVKYRHFCVM